MDTQEKDRALLSARRLEARELEVLKSEPDSFDTPYSDMTHSELIKLVMELTSLIKENQEQHKTDQAQISSLLGKIDTLSADLRASREETRQLRLQLKGQNDLEKKVASLEERLKLARQNRFGSKNQKRRKKSDKDNSDDTPVSHGEAKDGFDGTEESLPKNRTDLSDKDTGQADPSESKEKEARLFRQGMTYRTMCADKRIMHKSDMTRLPEGAVII